MEGEGRWGVRGGGSWVLSREGGRMGRGIDSNPNNNKAFKRPPEAGSAALHFSGFSGQGLRAGA